MSASGRMSCQTCHQPEHAHGGLPTDAVSPGGPDLERSGLRNSPSIRYASFTPAFHFEADGTPVGGFFRDGRAASLADQARRPFVGPLEMANPSIESVVHKLRNAAYVSEFMRLFGSDVFDDPTRAFDAAVFALARYQTEDPDFHPFDSKYDAFLAGKASLTDQEMRGFALFNDPLKGNCAACHPSTRGADGSPPMFTDFTYDNLGVPRNDAIPANADPDYVDLGLCGPQRVDLAQRQEFCGAFKVPSLRNVSRTAPYFHNGRFADPGRRRRVLRPARYESGGVVSDRPEWCAEVQRPARHPAPQRQYDRSAVQPPARRRARADPGRDRRRRRVPADAR